MLLLAISRRSRKRTGMIFNGNLLLCIVPGPKIFERFFVDFPKCMEISSQPLLTFLDSCSCQIQATSKIKYPPKS